MMMIDDCSNICLLFQRHGYGGDGDVWSDRSHRGQRGVRGAGRQALRRAYIYVRDAADK